MRPLKIELNGEKLKRRGRIAALALLVSLSGCDPSAPDWSKFVKADQTAANNSSAPPATTAEMVIYLDTSSSMAGYVSPNRQGSTVFSRTLQEVRNFSTIASPPLNVTVRRVDARVSAPYNDTFLSEASINRSIYNGSETNLSGAIDSFNGGENEPPARFHILITDGVQSTSQRRGDTSCTTGSDQICVRKKIFALLNRGWGAYVIGLRGEFDGRLYSEVSHAAIPYRTNPRDARTLRPFYVYLFSPDRAALDRLISLLRERLQPLVGQEDSMRTLALTSPYTDGAGQLALNVPKESSKLLTLTRETGAPTRYTLKVSPDANSPKDLTGAASVAWAGNVRESGSPQEMAELIKWELQPVYPEANAKAKARLPEMSVGEPKISPDGKVELPLTAHYPPGTGDTQWRAYRLIGRLNLERQTPAWIKRWSTDLDTTAEAGNRTLYLESALLGLWRNQELDKQIVAETYIRVGPK